MFKKQIFDSECRVFKKTLVAKYIFTEVKGKAKCLAYGKQVTVFKDYILKCHYVIKHEMK